MGPRALAVHVIPAAGSFTSLQARPLRRRQVLPYGALQSTERRHRVRDTSLQRPGDQLTVDRGHLPTPHRQTRT
ncbi:hypothetical protein KPP03845_200279 (plasmid) [Streptomyces xanthophaeus]|nr:hypothetical protein KPP03845_200279 [Streptomyces xanthophaeus]